MRYGKFAIGFSIVGCAAGVLLSSSESYQLPLGVVGFLVGAAIGATLDRRWA